MPKLSATDPSRWSYTTTGIIKRTGLTRREVEQLRREAREEANDPLDAREGDIQGIESREQTERKNPVSGIDLSKGATQKRRGIGLSDSPFSVEWDSDGFKGGSASLPGGGSVSWDREGEKGIEFGGFGVGMKPDGSGSIEFPGGTSIDYVVKGCFVVEIYKLFGVITHSNIQKKPGCEEGGEDEGGGGGEEKPPHCIGGGGKKMGGGKPEHQLPECADDGKSHQFVYYFSYINEWSYEYKRVSIPDSSPKSYYVHAIMSEPKCEPTPLDSYGGRLLPYGFRLDDYSIQESIAGEVLYENKRNFTSRMTGFFTGTFAEFKEHLGPPKDETKTSVNPNTGDVTVNRFRRWNTAIICEDGYDCNPTGNEGCGDSNSSPGGNGNNRKGDEPNQRPPKGRPSKPSKGDRGDDEMSKCCEDTKELLKLVLDAVGYNLSPIEVPSSLTDDEGLGKKSVVLPNLASFVIWWFGRWDEVIGMFPQTIEIEDIDPLTQGKQSKTVELANIAESFTELYGQMVSVVISQQLQLDMMHRTMLTAGLNRESGVRSEEMIEAVIDYLGFDTKQVNTKIPQLFTPDQEDFDRILEETSTSVRTVELKGNANLQAQLTELLHAASVIRARYFKKVDHNNAKQEIKGDLISMIGLMNKMRGVAGNAGDWEDFTNWMKQKYPDSKIDEKDINDFNRD